jgi:hypothetical protein
VKPLEFGKLDSVLMKHAFSLSLVLIGRKIDTCTAEEYHLSIVIFVVTKIDLSIA